RLLEVHAMVKTDRLATLHIDAMDEKGERLDGFPFIHMAPHSIGTDGWRMIRQVFRPRRPLQSVRILLAARGINGYTLNDTHQQPQNNVVGTIWWDDVTLAEPESTAGELKARGVTPVAVWRSPAGLRVTNLNFPDPFEPPNDVVNVNLMAPKPTGKLTLRWTYRSPGDSTEMTVAMPSIDKGSADLRLASRMPRPCVAYSEAGGTL